METNDIENEWKVIKSVGSVYGTTLNSKELSSALKNKGFHPDAGIIMHLSSGKPYQVNLVLKCAECEKIHLSFCNDDDVNPEYKKEIFKTDIIYMDRTGKDEYVSIGELISLLDDFKDAQNIGMDCVVGEDEDMKGTWTCAQVLKCTKECQNAHLTCYYEDEVS